MSNRELAQHRVITDECLEILASYFVENKTFKTRLLSRLLFNSIIINRIKISIYIESKIFRISLNEMLNYAMKVNIEKQIF